MALSLAHIEEKLVEVPKLYDLVTEVLRTIGRKPRPSDGYMHASAFGPPGKRCVKRLQFDFLNAEVGQNAANPTLAWATFKGKAVHNAIDEVFDFIPVPSERAISAKNRDLWLAGEVDRRFSYKNFPWIGEYKTIIPAGFKWLRKPMEKHVYQCHVYFLLFGIPRAILYYQPTAEPEADDPISLLKRALDAMPEESPMREHVLAALVSVDERDTPRIVRKQIPEAKQFEVYENDVIRKDILHVVSNVQSACAEKTWLEKYTENCDFCPYIRPCYAGAKIEEVNRRAFVEPGGAAGFVP